MPFSFVNDGVTELLIRTERKQPDFGAALCRDVPKFLVELNVGQFARSICQPVMIANARTTSPKMNFTFSMPTIDCTGLTAVVNANPIWRITPGKRGQSTS
jgi:hypothetical protein